MSREETHRSRIFWNNLHHRARKAYWRVRNKLGTPGYVQEVDFYDPAMESRFRVRIHEMFTIISVGPRDYWFRRRDGKFDGTGYAMCDSLPKAPTSVSEVDPRTVFEFNGVPYEEQAS